MTMARISTRFLTPSLRILTSLSVSVLLAAACGGVPDKLSRRAAERMIREHEEFPVRVHGDLYNLRHVDLKRLQDNGLVGFTWRSAWFGSLASVEFTDDGRLYVLGEGPRSAVVKLCDKEFVAVTGIVPFEYGVKGATVEYTYKYTNITPFGSRWPPTFVYPCDEDVHTSRITFVRYDDGWRSE